MAKVSQEGLNLIKVSEGLKLNAYLDSVNVPTIGFGTTVYPSGRNVALGDTITEEQAFTYLGDHLNDHVIPYIDSLVKVPLKQNQIDALASFIYNLGSTKFKSSTLLKKINSKRPLSEIGVEFAKWNKAGGKVLAGLVKRRQEEFKLYSK